MSIKVLHVIDSSGLFGAEIMLLNLVDEQLKAGLQPLILSAGTHDIDEKQVEKEAISRSLPLKKLRMRAGVDLLQAYKIIRYANNEGFDILHSHGFKFNVHLGVFPRFIRKIPIISTLHGYVMPRKYSKMWLYQALDRMMIIRLDHIVFVSRHMLEMPLFKLRNYRSYSVVNNGIHVGNEVSRFIKQEDLSPGTEIEEFIGGADILIGVISRLSPEKGVQDLLQAFKGVVNHMRGARLLVVGAGHYSCQLEAMIEDLGLNASVKMVGYSSNTYYYLSRFDLLVIPSHTEGLPMVLLEGMIAEKLIIACSVGGIPEVLGEGEYGFLVEPERPEALKDKMIEVCKKYIRGERFIGMRGGLRNRVQTYYSSERMAAVYSERYEETIRNWMGKS